MALETISPIIISVVAAIVSIYTIISQRRKNALEGDQILGDEARKWLIEYRTERDDMMKRIDNLESQLIERERQIDALQLQVADMEIELECLRQVYRGSWQLINQLETNNLKPVYIPPDCGKKEKTRIK